MTAGRLNNQALVRHPVSRLVRLSMTVALAAMFGCAPAGAPAGWSPFRRAPERGSAAAFAPPSGPPRAESGSAGETDESVDPSVDSQVRNFVARFPPDDRDRQAGSMTRTAAPGDSSASAGIASATPPHAATLNPSGQPHPPADSGTLEVQKAAVSAAHPLPAGESPAAASGPPSSAIVAMRPVQTQAMPATASTRPAGGSAVEGGPAPLVLPPALPEPIAPRPRVELIDVRPVTAAAVDSDASSSSANQPVQPAGTDRAIDLGRLVTDLERAVKDHPEHLDDVFKLRLLYLATGQDEKASGPVAGTDPVQSGLLAALFELVTTAKKAIHRPAAEPAKALAAVEDLRRLLAEQAPVWIPKIALVTRVNSFGDYEPVNPPRFPADAGVHVFLYTEVANFRSAPTPDGRLRTLLSARVEIYDPAGKVIWETSAPRIEDRVFTPRRDFFVPIEVRLPADTPPGEYVLKVTIEDQLGATADQQRMTLTIGN